MAKPIIGSECYHVRFNLIQERSWTYKKTQYAFQCMWTFVRNQSCIEILTEVRKHDLSWRPRVYLGCIQTAPQNATKILCILYSGAMPCLDCPVFGNELAVIIQLISSQLKELSMQIMVMHQLPHTSCFYYKRRFVCAIDEFSYICFHCISTETENTVYAFNMTISLWNISKDVEVDFWWDCWVLSKVLCCIVLVGRISYYCLWGYYHVNRAALILVDWNSSYGKLIYYCLWAYHGSSVAVSIVCKRW